MSTLLTYGIATNPSPLAVGRDGQLDIVVSNGGTKIVTCERITLVLPVSKLAQGLIAAEQQLTLEVSPSDQWSIVQAAQKGVLYAVPQDDAVDIPPAHDQPAAASSIQVDIEPKEKKDKTNENPGDVSKHGVLITIKGLHINDAYGTAAISVTEHAVVKGTDAKPEDRRTSVPVTKYPVTDANDIDPLPVKNFRTSALVDGKWTEGLTHLPHNTHVKLHWEGPAEATYTVSGTGRTETFEVPKGTTEYDFPAWAIRDSVYTLTATTTVGASIVTRHLTTAVTVDSPEFQAVSVKGDANFTKKLNLPAGLGVTGDVSVVGGDISLTRGDKELTLAVDYETGSLAIGCQIPLKGTPKIFKIYNGLLSPSDKVKFAGFGMPMTAPSDGLVLVISREGARMGTPFPFHMELNGEKVTSDLRGRNIMACSSRIRKGQEYKIVSDHERLQDWPVEFFFFPLEDAIQIPLDLE
ncbi:hypothetical protein AB8O64_35645 (plasmid) [Streptomyces sp. QH1-20]|uniref:hypothetical protein n=1 Tax=Streptomyces sp. QH1-20 TaxID=3240934 RepID=UPI0035127E31